MPIKKSAFKLDPKYLKDTVYPDKMSSVRDSIIYNEDDDNSINYENIKTIFEKYSEKNNISLQVAMGTLKYNSAWIKDEDCLVLKNKEHAYEYYNFCVLIRSSKGKKSVSFFSFGESMRMKCASDLENLSVFSGKGANGLKDGAIMGGAVGAGYAIGSVVGGAISSGGNMIKKAILSAGYDPIAIEEEKAWYSSVLTMFDELFE